MSICTGAVAAPRFVCDMASPSPPRLCAQHYAGYPALISDCIQGEVAALNFINEQEVATPEDVLEDCGAAGCQAGYEKLQTTAKCIRSMMSLKPRRP